MEFIKNMLEYASEKTGINYNKMVEYCKLYASDRRCKPFFLSSTCSWSWNNSGIIKYKNSKYYYNQYMDHVEVERI